MDISGTVQDLLGNPVTVGDEVAGAFRIGNVAVLRIGTVQGFGERANKLTVKVKWHHTSYAGSGESDITGAIEAELKRFVVLTHANTITSVPPGYPA